MSRPTTEYLVLEHRVIQIIDSLRSDFPGTITLTVSDETYAEMKYMLDLGTKLRNQEITTEMVSEQLRKLKYGEIQLPITGQEREYILTSA